ncbi:hypothetical protein L596_027590 [Steinernema carpocapsae]|uniref:Uncharacterized protein n=1 Tax=Steinernema carpocapsae TaxID=34508 RepID=A0A4U5LVY8_STECR|nr:hypothetical protein L596_027590 [Steinernema carpocapsae]
MYYSSKRAEDKKATEFSSCFPKGNNTLRHIVRVAMETRKKRSGKSSSLIRIPVFQDSCVVEQFCGRSNPNRIPRLISKDGRGTHVYGRW